MTSSLDKHIVELKREYPEWQPWLAVVHEILDETVNPVWDAIVPVRTGPQQRKVPLLTGVTMQQGYRRPEGAGYALDVTVVGKAMSKPSIFAWSWS